MKRLLAALIFLGTITPVSAALVQATLAWQDNSNNETGFGVERTTAAAVEFAEVKRLGANVVTTTDAGLRSGTTYTYRVFAFNAARNSAYSNTATVATPTTPNTAPTLTAPPDKSINQGVANSGALPVTIGDAETLPDNLDIIITSTNAALVPVANVVLAGTGALRTVTVTPLPGLTGSSTIGLDVGDGALRTKRTFVLTVVPFVAAPSALQITSP